MSVSFPYSAAAFADRLGIKSCVFDVQRNDETDGSGDGRVWQAELAPPLWVADVTLVTMTIAAAEQIAALIRKLSGAQESFYLYDTGMAYPQADPDGSTLGASTVQVNSVGADGASLSLKGLPAGYAVTLADRAHIDFGASPTRRYYFEASEPVTADGTGVTAEYQVFPSIPSGISADADVTLIKPAAKMFIMPGSFNAGSVAGNFRTGMSFKAMQRVR